MLSKILSQLELEVNASRENENEDIRSFRSSLEKIADSKILSRKESHSRTLELLSEIRKEYSLMEQKCSELDDLNSDLQRTVFKLEEERINHQRDLSEKFSLGISDLEKRNEEAIFDALSAFDKKCPYCDKDHYRVGIRDKIEIDHFIPIARGGQHVPWNLLPICKECNRKKKDRLPVVFLSEDIFQKCQLYLDSIRKKYYEEGIQQVESIRYLRDLIQRNMQFLESNASEAFVQEIIQLLAPEKIPDIYRRSTTMISSGRSTSETTVGLLDFLTDQITNKRGEFAKGVLMSPWGPICDRLQDIAPKDMGKITPRLLMQILLKLNWKDLGRINSREYPTKKHVFKSPDIIGLRKSEIRRLGEEKSNAVFT
jgi:5-methylcytosine-specific restriction endonuclease McrA